MADERNRRLGNALMAQQSDRNYPVLVPDDSFLQGPSLSQGPQPMPRNALADALRDYGLHGLSNRLNSPTSGAGVVADGVGGLLDAAVMQPAKSFKHLWDTGYEPGNPESAEHAMNVAGAAMVGGVAAPRPRNSLGAPKTFSALGYHGTPLEEIVTAGPRDRTPPPPTIAYRGEGGGPKHPMSEMWASSSPEIASGYGHGGPSPSVSKLHLNYNNPYLHDAKGSGWGNIEHRGQRASTDEIADYAKLNGHDGVVITNVRDKADTSPLDASPGVTPSTVYRSLSRGTTNNALTGYLLYANGGRPGAATGAAVNALAEHPVPGIRAYRGQFDNSPIGNRQGKVWGSSSPNVADEYAQTATALNPEYAFEPAMAPRITPLEYRFKNPLVVDNSATKRWDDVHFEGSRLTTDQLSDLAKGAGYDGLVVKNITDSTKNVGNTIAALQRGTVYSPLTGDLLYGLGGLGAATGAAVGAASAGLLDRQPKAQDWSKSMLPGDI